MGTRTAKIGILSDTHGQSEMAERAAAVLARHSPELVFHCGDIGGEAVINALLSLPMVYQPVEEVVFCVRDSGGRAEAGFRLG